VYKISGSLTVLIFPSFPRSDINTNQKVQHGLIPKPTIGCGHDPVPSTSNPPTSLRSRLILKLSAHFILIYMWTFRVPIKSSVFRSCPNFIMSSVVCNFDDFTTLITVGDIYIQIMKLLSHDLEDNISMKVPLHVLVWQMHISTVFPSMWSSLTRTCKTLEQEM
jgi:hypothetical protein